MCLDLSPHKNTNEQFEGLLTPIHIHDYQKFSLFSQERDKTGPDCWVGEEVVQAVQLGQPDNMTANRYIEIIRKPNKHR